MSRRPRIPGTRRGGTLYVLPEIRDAVLSQPDHPAWPLLDRPRVEALLSSPPAALDTMSRYYAWRLATVFGAVA